MRPFVSQPKEYVVVAPTVEIIDQIPPYCVGACTCGNDCYDNGGSHLIFTTWDGEDPSLYLSTDEEAERAIFCAAV